MFCAEGGGAFRVGASLNTARSSNDDIISTFAGRKSTRRASAVCGNKQDTLLQRICDRLVEGAMPGDVEELVMEVEAEHFQQASVWAKTWTPMRCVIADVPDVLSVSVLALPSGFLVLCFEQGDTLKFVYSRRLPCRCDAFWALSRLACTSCERE